MSRRTLVLVIIFCGFVLLAASAVLWLSFHKPVAKAPKGQDAIDCPIPKGAESGTSVFKAADGTCVVVPPGSPPVP